MGPLNLTDTSGGSSSGCYRVYSRVYFRETLIFSDMFTFPNNNDGPGEVR